MRTRGFGECVFRLFPKLNYRARTELNKTNKAVRQSKDPEETKKALGLDAAPAPRRALPRGHHRRGGSDPARHEPPPPRPPSAPAPQGTNNARARRTLAGHGSGSRGKGGSVGVCRSGGERKSKFAWPVSVVARVTHREVVLLVLLPGGVRTGSVASHPAPRLRAARSSRHVTSGCAELLGGRERGRRLCGKLPCGYGAAGHGGRQRGLRRGRKPGRVCGVLPGHVPPPLPHPPRRAPGKRPLIKTKRLGCSSGVPVIFAAELGTRNFRNSGASRTNSDKR